MNEGLRPANVKLFGDEIEALIKLAYDAGQSRDLPDHKKFDAVEVRVMDKILEAQKRFDRRNA